LRQVLHTLLLGLMMVLKSSVSSLTPTQKTPRVQQHNPRRMETPYRTVNSQQAFHQDNNKPAPTRIALHTTHLQYIKKCNNYIS